MVILLRLGSSERKETWLLDSLCIPKKLVSLSSKVGSHRKFEVVIYLNAFSFFNVDLTVNQIQKQEVLPSSF